MQYVEFEENILKTGVFQNNAFFKKYLDLINKYKNDKKIYCVNERHHIIPRKYYKQNKLKINNKKENIVYLSHYNHILSHYYLALCTKGKLKESMIYAFNLMCKCNENLLTLKEIEVLKKLKYFAYLRQNYSSVCSIKAKERDISEQKKEQIAQKISKSLKGIKKEPFTKEHRENMSKARKGKSSGTKNKICIYNDFLKKKKYINKDELNIYISEGWIKGGIPQSDEVKKLIGQNSSKCLKGSHRTEESKKKTSETLKKNYKDLNSGNSKARDFLKIKLKGKKRDRAIVEKALNAKLIKNNGSYCSEETKIKLSQKLKGRKSFSKGKIYVKNEFGKRKLINPEEELLYINNGWFSCRK